MNPSLPPFVAKRPVLKLPRRSVVEATTSPERASVMGWNAADQMEELRQREANLHDYEARLRAWQAELDRHGRPPAAPASSTFFRPPTDLSPANDPALTAAWRRLYRARELLESEQKQLREDRHAHREAELALKQRAVRLEEREAVLIEREQRAEAALAQTESRKVGSVMRRLTQAPFSAAKTIFKAG